eukprot:scaffold94682_cov20-Cyclotella_meneghiniana.AAC.1
MGGAWRGGIVRRIHLHGVVVGTALYELRENSTPFVRTSDFPPLSTSFASFSIPHTASQLLKGPVNPPSPEDKADITA